MIPARAAPITETTIPKVSKDTRAEMTGIFKAADKSASVTLSARLKVAGKEAIPACDGASIREGEYSFKVVIDFAEYLKAGETADATVKVASSAAGTFEGVKVTRSDGK